METKAGKEKVVEEKQPPPTAKTSDVKALKEKDGKGDDGGKPKPKKGATKCPKSTKCLFYTTNLI